MKKENGHMLTILTQIKAYNTTRYKNIETLGVRGGGGDANKIEIFESSTQQKFDPDPMDKVLGLENSWRKKNIFS